MGVHDKHPLPDLLHGNERRVYGDSAYAMLPICACLRSGPYCVDLG